MRQRRTRLTLALLAAIIFTGYTALTDQVPFFRLSRGVNPPSEQPPGNTNVPDANPAIPKATESVGGKPARFEMADGVLTTDFTARRVMWEVQKGVRKEAWTINGAVPGPLLELTEGTRYRVRVRNDLPEATSIHLHGIPDLANEMDGVAPLTQNPIEPGETFVLDFFAARAGTYWYHSHFDGAKQVSNGLYGAIIVRPKAEGKRYDKEFIVMIGDAGLGFTVNGKSYPATEVWRVKEGDRVLVRMINVGVGPHPMHIHGHEFAVVAKDGYPRQPEWNMNNVVSIFPGETYDMAFVANNPGRWFFHCHILPHAEGANGMFGLTQVMIYEGFDLPKEVAAEQQGDGVGQ